MVHVHRALIVGMVLFATGVGGAVANAADQGVSGKKLLLKSGKLVLISKDPSINVTGSDPVGGSDSSVTFDAGSGPVTFSLPKTNWSSAGTVLKYNNTTAPGGPSVVKIAKLKSGLLKVVAKGLPFAVPAGSATIYVVFNLDGGSNNYCLTFSGTGDGQKLLVKDAAAGACAFPNSTIVAPSEGPQINDWVGSPGEDWVACYRKSRDGADSTVFHALCDGKGPSVTVARLDNGLRIGGYASDSWTSVGSYFGNPPSFLFSLTNVFKHVSLGLPYYMYGYSTYGPTFGGGHDWYIDGSVTGGYCNLGHTYACRVDGYGSAACRDDFCGSYSSWSITDLEVWVLP